MAPDGRTAATAGRPLGGSQQPCRGILRHSTGQPAPGHGTGQVGAARDASNRIDGGSSTQVASFSGSRRARRVSVVVAPGSGTRWTGPARPPRRQERQRTSGSCAALSPETGSRRTNRPDQLRFEPLPSGSRREARVALGISCAALVGTRPSWPRLGIRGSHPIGRQASAGTSYGCEGTPRDGTPISGNHRKGNRRVMHTQWTSLWKTRRKTASASFPSSSSAVEVPACQDFQRCNGWVEDAGAILGPRRPATVGTGNRRDGAR